MITPVTSPAADDAWEVAAATPDPELPCVTIGDLGILRRVVVTGSSVIATITPTYSGCPALADIGAGVRRRLLAAGWAAVAVRTELDPPWTTDAITVEGRRKLAAAGIAPPQRAERADAAVPVRLTPSERPVECPRCGSSATVCTAEFGATACKALYRCEACREPFEYVKAR